MTAIRARGWGWRHPGRRAWAVRDLDLDLAAGQRVLLLGPSGSGKSTLLAGLAGLLDPQVGDVEGDLLLDGVPTRQARARAATGLLLQDPQAQTVLARCGDDIAFGPENHCVPQSLIWPRVDAALDAVGLRYGRSHPTAELSGGERQRLALAGVIALQPGLMLLDEPTAMLDRPGAEQLHDVVGQLLSSTEAGCVIVEHRVAPWLDLIDTVVVLGTGGQLLATGPARQVLAEQGEWLAAQGVWVPGREPGRPVGPRITRPTSVPSPGSAAGWATASAAATASARLTSPSGELLLTGQDVTVRRGRRTVTWPGRIDVTAGGVSWLLGPNGYGKSSTALALAGLLQVSAGEVRATPALLRRLEPPPRRPEPATWRAGQLASRIGTVFQDPQHQFLTGSCADELALAPRRLGLGKAEVDHRVNRLLDLLHLGDLAAAHPFTLSGGQQRRLSVAAALTTDPAVLVLDEPTFGQDCRTWQALVDLLQSERRDGRALVIASHDELLVQAMGESAQVAAQ